MFQLGAFGDAQLAVGGGELGLDCLEADEGVWAMSLLVWPVAARAAPERAGAWTTPRGRVITHCPGRGEWLGSGTGSPAPDETLCCHRLNDDLRQLDLGVGSFRGISGGVASLSPQERDAGRERLPVVPSGRGG